MARVILRPGDGSIQVNKRTLEEYFPRAYLQTVAKQPLVQSGYEGNVDVRSGCTEVASPARRRPSATESRRRSATSIPRFVPSSSAGEC